MHLLEIRPWSVTTETCLLTWAPFMVHDVIKQRLRFQKSLEVGTFFDIHSLNARHFFRTVRKNSPTAIETWTCHEAIRSTIRNLLLSFEQRPGRLGCEASRVKFPQRTTSGNLCVGMWVIFGSFPMLSNSYRSNSHNEKSCCSNKSTMKHQHNSDLSWLSYGYRKCMFVGSLLT